jgi:hypothetical protein
VARSLARVAFVFELFSLSCALQRGKVRGLVEKMMLLFCSLGVGVDVREEGRLNG